MICRLARALLIASVCLAPTHADAEKVTVDSVVAHFVDPEGDHVLRAIFQRELNIEAWLDAFEDSRNPPASLNDSDSQIRQALERLAITELLGERPLPEDFEKLVPAEASRMRTAQKMAVGGDAKLAEALTRATGEKAPAEFESIILRRARATIYLRDSLAGNVPSEPELHEAHMKCPDSDIVAMKFEQARPLVYTYVRWLKSREALQTLYSAIRTRLHLTLISNSK